MPQKIEIDKDSDDFLRAMIADKIEQLLKKGPIYKNTFVKIELKSILKSNHVDFSYSN